MKQRQLVKVPVKLTATQYHGFAVLDVIKQQFVQNDQGQQIFFSLEKAKQLLK